MATIRTAIIYVFSGTGNTRLAADSVQRYLLMNQIHAHVYSVRCGRDGSYTNPPDPNNYDICGFAYPVHAGNTPKFMLKFVKSLPPVTGRKLGMPAFIFSTAGSYSPLTRSASSSLASALRSKGMMPGIDMRMIMPYNIGVRITEMEAKYMRIHTEKMARVLAYMIKNRQFETLHFNPFVTAAASFGKIQRAAAARNGRKFTVEEDKCIGCGICEKRCPSSNIIIKDGIPAFEGRCTMCMGCVTYCPYMAIHPGMMDRYKINLMWDYDSLAYDESISDNALKDKNCKVIQKYLNYYKETTALYNEIFRDEVSGRKNKRQNLGRAASASRVHKIFSGEIPADMSERNIPRPVAEHTVTAQTDSAAATERRRGADISATVRLGSAGLRGANAAGTGNISNTGRIANTGRLTTADAAKVTKVSEVTLEERIAQTTRISLEELKRLAAQQLGEQDEFIESLFNGD